MDQGTKKILKMLALPFFIFMTLPAALGFKIYYALKTHQPVMEADYDYINRNYDQYAKEIDKHNRIVKSNVLNAAETTLKPGANTIPFTVLDKADNKPVSGSLVKLRLSRSATVNQDSNAECTTDANGQCSMSINLAAAGPWDIKVQTHDEKGAFFLVQRVIIPK